ncbi:hypothetical protein METP2_02463 [Methanosarcinales archaeon]|nr:hypothetical protein METP2_02463 [Methanosarcinales archaeon]
MSSDAGAMLDRAFRGSFEKLYKVKSLLMNQER